MALAGTTIWECQATGSDTLNGGAFDPGQSAGMFADGAATLATSAAPVFTSASYNFIAGDVGAWLYISSGTNWTAGWYKIASVAANAATLNATIGQGVIKTAMTPTTVVGCATIASPASATWTIDYSQQAAAQFAYTDLATAGTGLTVTSAAKPFAKQHVGNSIVITGGTNFNAGRYVIASISGVTATVVGPTNISTGAGASGTGGLGGALASPGMMGSLATISLMHMWVLTGTYTMTSATHSISGGTLRLNSAGGNLSCRGYGAVRGDNGTPPTFVLGSGVTSALIVDVRAYGYVHNFILDGNLQTGSQALAANNGNAGSVLSKLQLKNCVGTAFLGGNITNLILDCSVTGCTGLGFDLGQCAAYGCVGFANSNVAFKLSTTGSASHCISYGNTGATTDGFQFSAGATAINCVAYNNGRNGFLTANDGYMINCHAEANALYGYNLVRQNDLLRNCTAYANGTAAVNMQSAWAMEQTVTSLTASPFVNAAAGNFALNNTAGAGAVLRGTGFPRLFPGGLTTGYLDIGAAQHNDTSYWFNKAKQELFDGTLDLDTSTLKAMLMLSTYVFDPDVLTVSALTGEASGATRQTLTNRASGVDHTLNIGYLTADPVNFPGVTTGQSIAGMIVLRDTGSDATSVPVCFFPFTLTTTGANVVVTFPVAASGGAFKAI